MKLCWTHRYLLGLRLGDDPHVLQVKVSNAASHRQSAVDIWLSQTVPRDEAATSLDSFEREKVREREGEKQRERGGGGRKHQHILHMLNIV